MQRLGQLLSSVSRHSLPYTRAGVQGHSLSPFSARSHPLCRSLATWSHVCDLPGKVGAHSCVKRGDDVLILGGARGLLSKDMEFTEFKSSLPSSVKGLATNGDKVIVAAKKLMDETCELTFDDAESPTSEKVKHLTVKHATFGMQELGEDVVLVGSGYMEEISGEGCAVHVLDRTGDAPVWKPLICGGEAPMIPTGGSMEMAALKPTAANSNPRIMTFSLCEDGTELQVRVLDVASMTWETPMVGGTAPGPLSNFCAVQVGGKVVLTGGLTYADNIVCRAHNPHVYAIDADTYQWSIVETEGECPSRFSHSSVGLDDSRLLVLGGSNEIKSLKDVRLLDLSA